MTVIDVLIAKHFRGPDQVGNASGDDLIWFRRNKLYLTHDESIWVGDFPDAQRVMDACEPAGENFKPTRMFDHYYTIVNEHPTDPDNPNWDIGQPLTEIIGLSRLVAPTPLGFEYAARIRTLLDGQTQIIPVENGAKAYTSRTREWLTRHEWEEVRSLAEAWTSLKASAPTRLWSSIWYREKLAREQHLDVRWVLLATALESLIGIWTNAPRSHGQVPGRGRQFVTGVCKLATHCGLPFTEADTREAWERRSSLAHGAGWPSGSLKDGEPSGDLHVRLEAVLNAAIRGLIMNQSFRAHFESDQNLVLWLGY